MKIVISIFICLSISSSLSVAQVSDWKTSRTSDGQPDLQDIWENNTITPVEKSDRFGVRQYLTNEEQILLERRVIEIADEDGDALFGDEGFEAALSGVVNSYDPSTGNNNQAWQVERAFHNRNSQILDPRNEKYPPLAGEADGETVNRPQQGNTNPES